MFLRVTITYTTTKSLLKNDTTDLFNIHDQIQTDIFALITPVYLNNQYSILPVNKFDGKVLYINDFKYYPPNIL